jgi:hypothetical protein
MAASTESQGIPRSRDVAGLDGSRSYDGQETLDVSSRDIAATLEQNRNRNWVWLHLNPALLPHREPSPGRQAQGAQNASLSEGVSELEEPLILIVRIHPVDPRKTRRGEARPTLYQVANIEFVTIRVRAQAEPTKVVAKTTMGSTLDRVAQEVDRIHRPGRPAEQGACFWVPRIETRGDGGGRVPAMRGHQVIVVQARSQSSKALPDRLRSPRGHHGGLDG